MNTNHHLQSRPSERRPRLWIAVVVSLFWGLQAHAAGTWAEGIGEAPVESPTARDDALNRALTNAVVIALGTSLTSTFTSYQREDASKLQSAFISKTQSKLRVDSKGFVQEYEILSSAERGGTLTIQVRAKIYASKAAAELAAFDALAKRASRPSVWIVIQDRQAKAGKIKAASQSKTLGPKLESALSALGFEVKLLTGIGPKVWGSAKRFDGYAQSSVLRAAKAATIDYLLIGSLHVEDLGKVGEEAQFKALIGQTKVNLSSELRVIDVADARIVSSQAAESGSFGTTIERAVHRAMKGRGKNVFEQTYRPIFESLKRDLEREVGLSGE